LNFFGLVVKGVGVGSVLMGVSVFFSLVVLSGFGLVVLGFGSVKSFGVSRLGLPLDLTILSSFALVVGSIAI
jgi:hypothetical protein